MPPMASSRLVLGFDSFSKIVLVVLFFLQLTPSEMAPAVSFNQQTSPEVGRENAQLYSSTSFNGVPNNFKNLEKASNSATLMELVNWAVNSHQQELQQKQEQKRHLFLSDGWGPGGRTLAIASKNRSGKNGNQQQPQLKQQNIVNEVANVKQKNDAKSQKQQLQHYKWAIPGLFGQF